MKDLIVFPHSLEGNTIQILTIVERPIRADISSYVPKDFPYLFVDPSEFPESREFRDAWVADFSNPDGYGTKEIELPPIPEELQ